MSKIVLEVDDRNVDTVLLILKNLKQGLVKNISRNKGLKKEVLQDEFMSSTKSTGKYLSKSAYKQKIHQKEVK